MLAAIKRAWPKIWPNALVLALIACVPFGLFMSWFMDNSDWLWLCATLIIFMS
jgi:hypothetical protein